MVLKITVHVASFTLAQWSTEKSSLMTLAVSLANNQAGTVEQQWTSFAGIWQTGPTGYSCLDSIIPFPTPFSWVWNVGNFGQRSFPNESCNVQCSFCVLEQCTLGWWNGFQRFETKSKHQLSCFINRSRPTVFAVHQHCQTFQTLHMQC